MDVHTHPFFDFAPAMPDHRAMSARRRLFLIDGMALVYRGHFALFANPRRTSAGLNTSAVFVFANVLLDILSREKPDALAVVFDTPEPTHRHTLYPAYKAQREAMPEDIALALPYVDRLCAALRIPTLRLPGWEADDVIGTLADRAAAEGFTTYMVTSDKDYAQLVDEHTYLYRPDKRGGFDTLGPAEILRDWGVARVEQVVDVLGLMGDTSDNIPGVPGIGPKTAQQLIATYGSLENLLERSGEIPGRRGETLRAQHELARLSKILVTIDRAAPIQTAPADLTVGEPDPDALRTLCDELEFHTLSRKLLGDATAPDGGSGEGSATQAPLATLADTPHVYRCADDEAALESVLSALALEPRICLDLETTGLDARRCEIVGLAFAWRTGEAWFVPVPPEPEGATALLQRFAPFFARADVELVGHHLKFDLTVLRWHGHRLHGRIFDTLLAAALALPDGRHTLDALAGRLLGYRPVPIEALIGPADAPDGQRSMRDVPRPQLVEYAGEDADVTLRLADTLAPLLETSGQTRVFRDVEAPLLPVLIEMEYAGIRIDPDALAALGQELDREVATQAARILALAGEDFSINSPRQLGAILFDKLGLDPKAKRTGKTGQYATDEKVLTRLAGRHEIARCVLQYRMAAKLRSTYVDQLPAAVMPRTGRIHTQYEQLVTATGRLQSHNPNLQNIPVRSEMGREIRRAFVPRSDAFVLLAADYSQIELRIAAALSGDEALGAAFRDGQDIHAAAAARLHGVDSARVTPEMRRRAKMVNFGILYGISAFGLAERTGMSRQDARDLIDRYFATYPGLRQWIDDTIAFAHAKGYVETLTGRRRWLPDIASRNATTRAAAERNATNAPVQGTAADMIKIAMARIQRDLDTQRLATRLLLQVHDELVFELHRDEETAVRELVRAAMVEALPLAVPIVVELGVGTNWLDAH
jgi:DNA polymerase I